MAAIFGEGKIFWKLSRVHSLDTFWVENFDEIALSRTVKEIQAILCFSIFGKKSKIQNGRHFWRGENFFWKLPRVQSLDTLCIENFDEIALSRTVKEIQAILCFSIFGKKSKIQNGRHFWRGEIFFWKLPRVQSLDTLWVENFDEIALSRTVKEIEAILRFSIFGEGKIFENCQEYIPVIPCGSKISTKSLYLARLRRYKQFRVFPFLAKNRKFKMAAIFGRGKFFENSKEYAP